MIDFGKWTDEELLEIFIHDKEFICNQLKADIPYSDENTKSINLNLLERLKSCDIDQLDETQVKYIIDKYKHSLWLVQYYEFFKIFGVVSLTEHAENILMWAHYANNSGFILEFNFKKWDSSIFHGPYPINYCKNIEQCLYKNYGEAAFLYHTNVKSILWNYESEWRFLAYRKEGLNLTGVDKKMKILTDRKFPIGNTIASITLGSHFFDNKETIIKNNKLHIIVSDDKLRVINHILNKGKEPWMIMSPDISVKPKLCNREYIEL